MEGLGPGARARGFLCGAGRRTLVDVGIADAEVGEVVVAGHPRGHGVADLVGLWLEALTLYETAEWFGVAEVLLHRRSWSDAGAQFLLVITAREVVHLTGALEEHFLALVDVGEDGFVTALGDEAVETGVLGEDAYFFLESR